MEVSQDRARQRLAQQDERLIAFGASTDRAGRETNEDHCTLQPERRASRPQLGTLAVVADGMGGGTAGRTASELTVTALVEGYFDAASDSPLANLQDAVSAANGAVAAFARNARRSSQVGSTVVAAAITGGRASVIGVGDSRAYLVRNGTIAQITRDHTWANLQIDSERMSPTQARSHPNSLLLTSVLGQHTSSPVPLTGRADDKFSFQRDLMPGDALVLCSDGIYNAVPDSEIGAVAAGYPAQQAARELVSRARQRGTTDNATAVLIQYGMAASRGAPPRWLAWVGGLVALLALTLTAWLVAPALGFGQSPAGTAAPTSNVGPSPVSAPALSVASVVTPVATFAPTPRGVVQQPATATPLPSQTPTPTQTPSATPTQTLTPLPSPTATADATLTAIRAPSTDTDTDTPTPTATAIIEPSEEPAPSATRTTTPTISAAAIKVVIAIQPATGTLDQRFTVSGSGFIPKEKVSIWLTTPDRQNAPVQDNVQVDERGFFGNVSFVVNEVKDLPAGSAQPGRWAISVRGYESHHPVDMWFDITP